MKNDFVYFYYHMNCLDISDNRGDNDNGLVESIQNTVNASYLFKFHQIDVNELDLKLFSM